MPQFDNGRFLSALFVAIFLSMVTGCTNDSQPANGSIRLRFAHQGSTPLNDSLYPIFPNPFNRTAGDTNITIRFALNDTGIVAVLIQNVIGEEIAGYTDSLLPSGIYYGQWNPIASDGTPLISGLYFITLHAGNYINSRLVNVENND
jgi:hypothetical protein